MSRYGVDKVLRRLVQCGDDARRAFLHDPGDLMDGCDLSPEESRALTEGDVGSLYQMGAHPFLLWCGLWRLDGGRFDDFTNRYVDAVRDYGTPSYGTSDDATPRE